MSAKKYKRKMPHEKPLFCDPGMCDNCQYIGDGDFICNAHSEESVMVVEDWMPTLAGRNCPKRRRSTEKGICVHLTKEKKYDIIEAWEKTR